MIDDKPATDLLGFMIWPHHSGCRGCKKGKSLISPRSESRVQKNGQQNADLTTDNTVATEKLKGSPI